MLFGPRARAQSGGAERDCAPSAKVVQFWRSVDIIDYPREGT